MSETEDRYWSNFKAISLSVCMALWRANQAHLTGNLLILASFTARIVPPNIGCECRRQLIEIEEEHLHALGRELRRSTLITAVGILDFCLFETLIFMVSTHPDVLNRLPSDFRKGSDPLASAKKALKRTSIKRRLELINEALLVSVPESLRSELEPLLDKRHAITHQSKFYETALFGDTIGIQIHPFPEVSRDESTIALFNVTEIADCVLVTVAKDYFHAELGGLRPLTPPVADVHKELRLKIETTRAQGPIVEEVHCPDWDTFVFNDIVFVADRDRTLMMSPFVVDYFPVSVSCPKQKVHGEKVYILIDSGEREEAGFMNAAFLARLLAGKSILVEYQEYSSDVPLYRRLSLEGFPQKWAEAQAVKAALETAVPDSQERSGR